MPWDMPTISPANDAGKRQSASNLVQAALKYGRTGWRMFPVEAGNKKPPLVKGWPEKATCHAGQIEAWASKFPGCNWGVATGAQSGVFVLDCDGEAGRALLAALESQHGKLPATLTSRTGRIDGGEHRWFTCKAGVAIGNRGLGEGLDIRGERGYAMVPPCRHPSGAAYEWAAPETAIADASPWLMKLLAPASAPVLREDQIIPNGQRNSTLTSIAGRMRRNGASKEEIHAELLIINRDKCEGDAHGNLLSDADIGKIAASVARYDPAATPSPQQSLQSFVSAAIDKNGLDYVCRTKWMSPMFAFARLLKARPEFSTIDGYAAAQALDIVLTESFSVPDPWHSIFGELSDDPRVELIKTWSSVKVPAVGDPLVMAHEAAQGLPLKPLRIYSERYAQFISLAGHLQSAYPGQTIAVPLERFGKLLSCHHTMVSKYRRIAEDDGLLTKESKYIVNKRAAEFRFRVEWFDWGTGEQHCPLSLDSLDSP
jgi:Bifunctional DNA primase/polymerase, N-terminal/Primase C terminal 1 (PriCT-1)